MSQRNEKGNGSGFKSRPRAAKFIVIFVVAVLFAAAAVFALITRGDEEADTVPDDIITQISGYKGYTRVVSREEFDFFKALVARDLENGADDETVEDATREYINTVNAEFYLGSKLGLCEVYDFSAMQYRMETENADRQAKSESGEVFYGPQSFTLTTYFQYIYSNLQSDLLNYLVSNATEDMLRGARDYYDATPSLHQSLQSITYKITENGASETVNITADEYRTLQNSDETLADFISEADEGDTMTYEYSGVTREVELVSVEYAEATFEDNAAVILRYYISENVLDGLIETVAENNPVEFSAQGE